MTEENFTLEEVKKLLEALEFLPFTPVRAQLELKLRTKFEILKLFSNDHSPSRNG